MTQLASKPALEHRTIVLGRTFAVPIERVYAALTDPLERARMGASSDRYALIIDAADHRVGGRDCFRFGLKGQPRLRGEAIYHRIEPPTAIIATEIVHADEICVSVSLVTLALGRRGAETDVKLTVQLLSLTDDEDLADEAGARHAALLEDLARHLGTPSRDRRRPFSRR
jgi:uncharacterized protein YndB with AHSA1/START domain